MIILHLLASDALFAIIYNSNYTLFRESFYGNPLVNEEGPKIQEDRKFHIDAIDTPTLLWYLSVTPKKPIYFSNSQPFSNLRLNFLG
jgi:hypothetical protein